LEKRFTKEARSVWAIRVWEEQTPEGEEPLEWIGLPSVSTTTLEQAWERVGWYERRWVVEDYLKSAQNRLPPPRAPGADRRPGDALVGLGV
jgi:hypothetical protein